MGFMKYRSSPDEEWKEIYALQGEPGKEGPPGQDGEPGAPGYTPQRGIDYWTDTDKEEIINEIGDATGGDGPTPIILSKTPTDDVKNLILSIINAPENYNLEDYIFYVDLGANTLCRLLFTYIGKGSFFSSFYITPAEELNQFYCNSSGKISMPTRLELSKIANISTSATVKDWVECVGTYGQPFYIASSHYKVLLYWTQNTNYDDYECYDFTFYTGPQDGLKYWFYRYVDGNIYKYYFQNGTIYDEWGTDMIMNDNVRVIASYAWTEV